MLLSEDIISVFRGRKLSDYYILTKCESRKHHAYQGARKGLGLLFCWEGQIEQLVGLFG